MGATHQPNHPPSARCAAVLMCGAYTLLTWVPLQRCRFLGLISHLDITLPAPSATCRITIRDGQGQEVSTPGSSSSASDGYGLQQQQQAGQHAAAMAAGDVGGGSHSWQWLEALGVPCDRVYVLKEANASGLASLQQEITPEMKSAWVKNILSSSQDRQQQQVRADGMWRSPTCWLCAGGVGCCWAFKARLEDICQRAGFAMGVGGEPALACLWLHALTPGEGVCSHDSCMTHNTVSTWQLCLS